MYFSADTIHRVSYYNQLVVSRSGKNRGDGCWGATPTEHLFEEISARYVRYSIDNCTMMNPTSDSHGWIYEAEVWGCSE